MGTILGGLLSFVPGAILTLVILGALVWAAFMPEG